MNPANQPDPKKFMPEGENEHLKREQRRKNHPIQAAYKGSSGSQTRRVLRNLEAIGLMGDIAAELFRTQKASSRAKKYRGDYVDYAYERKGEHLKRLCDLLARQGDLTWGWGTDQNAPESGATDVLYVDLPNGQASFHSFDRHTGPDYIGEWDGKSESEANIICFAERLNAGEPVAELCRQAVAHAKQRKYAVIRRKLRSQWLSPLPVKRHNAMPNWIQHCRMVIKSRLGQLTVNQGHCLSQLIHDHVPPGDSKSLSSLTERLQKSWSQPAKPKPTVNLQVS